MVIFFFDQIGIDLINFLISFFADAYDLQFLIVIGAWFHAHIPSFMNVFFDNSEKLFVGSISFVIDLIALISGPDDSFSRLNGWSSLLTAFHISDSFIWAFIWFTDNILNLVRRVAVLILSLILELFSSLNILFWDKSNKVSTRVYGSSL